MFSHRSSPLESRLLILVHLIVGNEPYKDSEVAEATASSVSIYPGQDCDIAWVGILTGILVCTWL